MNNHFENKLNVTNDELIKTKDELIKTKDELNKTNAKLDKTNNEFKETKKLFRKKIKSLKIKLGLTNEIINQTENYNNERHECLESKINVLINSYKSIIYKKIEQSSS